MSEGTATATELTSQYMSQVAGDLEHNIKEQERISAQLTELQGQLATLQHDHAVLVSIQQALGVQAAVPEPAGADSASVPSPRKKSTPAPGTRRPAKAAPTQEPRAKKQPGTKTATKKAAAKSARPTLVNLIHRHLTEQSEPRSAAEVAEALDHAHPDRTIATNVVRTTLENLVAKSLVQRTKQGSSVFYTAVGAPEPATPTGEAQPETAG
ncbi:MULTISPECIES: BlaI/MecI/CopY family transcriptional regulator [unclassified Streptomyces]|uniref:BlaI/MecI/CopY family transcriptional regulator n=1 Tax=unclassified Streptomyces TaxID=2593676 RepID=UPI0011A033F6|nr:BlaI/MecI/CopY family transcriptional regulator [Streptomyces sp. BK340]TVZ76406.1 penicillinase repressor [Streptomyces sp. BK340]